VFFLQRLGDAVVGVAFGLLSQCIDLPPRDNIGECVRIVTVCVGRVECFIVGDRVEQLANRCVIEAAESVVFDVRRAFFHLFM
jgi:hypothetical protein